MNTEISDPKFCWNCSHPLAKKPGETDKFYYREVLVDGVNRRMHICCANDVEANITKPQYFEGAKYIAPDA